MKVLYAVVASIALAAFAAAPASAAVVVATPSISGSGSISGGTTACSRASVANGTITPCGATQNGVPINGFPGIIVLTATPQASPADHWVFAGWQGCPIPSGNVCQMIFSDAGTYFFTPRAVFVDSTGPTITLTAAPTYSTTVDRTVTMSWSTNEPLLSTSCSIDGQAFVVCPNNGSQALTLPEGTHTFRVQARDLSNNLGPISGMSTFRILDTALVSGPADVSNVKSPTFTFSSLSGLTFECSIDSVTLADCGGKGGDNRGSKSFTNLAEGVHTFRVRAKDGPEFDRVPVVRTWRVDSVAPVARLDANSGPGQGALQAVNAETFNFDSNEAGSTFQCRLDSADFAPCTSGIVVDHLTAGAHTFEVRAVDLAGNVGPAAARRWSVAANDDDNDGFNAQIDCNDADPSIRPGAIEILDNAVDENCDGIVGTTPAIVQGTAKVDQVLVTLAFFATASKKTTKFTTLQVKNVPLGATVTVTCKGKGCPSGLKRKGFTKKNAFGTVTLAKFIKKPLKAKDVITVVVSKPNAIAAIKILTVRAGKKPVITTKCQPPGAKSPVAC